MSELINNEAEKRFELKVDGGTAIIEYIIAKGNIYLTHTEVPKSLEGHGIGSKIVKLTLEWIDAHDLTLVPLCPFVATYLKRHPEWKRLVYRGINIE